MYALEVIGDKLEGGVQLFQVHYVGWLKKYDEWRNASDLIDIPQVYLSHTKEKEETFRQQIKIAIKEEF